MPEDIVVKESYASFIHSFEWDFYSTITFRRLHRCPINAMGKIWQAFEKLSASRAFVAVEKHSFDGVHIHALSRHTFRPDLRSESMWKYCFKAFGRTRVEPIESRPLVSWYVSKYVMKDGYDYSFCGEKSAWLLDP